MSKALCSARRLAAIGLRGLVLCCAATGIVHAQAAPSNSGVQATRFASLKSDRVQLHHGPGTEFPVAWVFRRAGMPVEITRENEAWSQVRASDGTTGWVWTTALSRRRTVLVLPHLMKPGQDQQETVPMRDDDRESAATIANIEAGVLASVIDCNGRWCRISVGTFRGYVEQAKLWGTHQGEVIR